MVHRRMLRYFCRGALLLNLPVQFALAQVGGLGDEWRGAHFDPGSGLPSTQVLNVIDLPFGTPWVHTSKGLSWYDGYRWHGVPLDSGLVSCIGQGCISAGFDGVLLVIPPHLYNVTAFDAAYVGTTRAGVAVLHHALLATSVPRIVFDVPIVQSDAGILSWHVNAPWEEIPTDAVRNRYRLDDQPWSEWSEVRSVTMLGLGRGMQNLAVQTKGVTGRISLSPETIAFDVLPPLFMRPMFYLPVGVLLLAVAALLLNAARRKREYNRTLREQDARFRAVVEHQSELILRLVPDGTISFVNEAFCRLMGKTREALVGQRFASLFSGYGDGGCIDEMMRVTPDDGVVEYDMLYHLPGGGDRGIRWSSSAIQPMTGSAGELQLIGRDTTDRRAAEELLVRSEARYRIVAEQTGQMVYDADLSTGSIAWLGAIEAVMGYTGEEFSTVTMQKWLDLIHEEDRAEIDAALKRCIDLGERVQHTCRVLHKNGSFISVLANGIPVPGPDGRTVRILGTIMDITERRHAESVIAASLKEKEVLLKEIHHRVKNNLQVISSLLNLQAAAAHDPQTLEQLKESQNRIRSIALIHERLYQSENLAYIDFGEYVRGVVSYLARSYSVPNVRVNIDVQNVNLAVNTAIPCGLIINELVSNALKYAFPDGKKGEVSIGLAVNEGKWGILTVRDDGVGLPSTIDFEQSTTLGLQLVNTLSRQLSGSTVVTRDSGTSISITFPVEA
jgi:PAS domain S-box-containing protein